MDETENVEESSSHITQPTTHEVGKNAKYSYKYYMTDLKIIVNIKVACIQWIKIKVFSC